MAAGTTSPETQSRRGLAADLGTQVIEYDRYIENQLHRTRRQVKGVDISSSLMLLVVGVLAYLMLVAMADHWLVAGGLSFAGRMVAFGLLALGVVAFGVVRLAPLIMRRINPVYAAYTIERHRPGIKNGLINFLMLRSGSDRLPERIYEAMEVQAVNALTTAHVEVAVDRSPVIRLLLALVAVIFCLSLYAVLSPKSLFRSFGRVVSPWSDLAPPTRVAISDIQPGAGSGFHDQHVAVSAQVDGLRNGEPVTLRYSTLDGQVVSRPVTMSLPESSYRHVAELPADNLGLQQDLEYWIEAGDAISPHYRLKVDTAPAIVVEEIEYRYPKYAELPPRKVARHGDIQALAGTTITLRAKANQVIRQANLDFECDGRNDLDMQVDGPRASVGFSLAFNDKARRAEHESYQLRFRNDDGHENPKPIRYSIEVIRDLPPEIELVEPELDPTKDLVVPAGKPVRFAVQAADPDFKLATVGFHARRGTTALVEESLLAAPRGGEFRRDFMLDLKRLGLKPGEQIEFWAAADDNREPQANHSETPHYQLRIASDDANGQDPQDPNADNDDKNGPPKGDDANQKQSGQPSGKGQQQGNESGDSGDQDSNKKQSSGKAKTGKNNRSQQDEGEDSGDGEPSAGDKSQQADSGEKPQQGGSSDKKSGEGQAKSGEGEEGQGGKGAQKGGGDKSDQDKRLDPQRDAGKAIDEINKHFNQKENKQDQPGPGGKKQQGKKQQGQKQQGEQSGEKGQQGGADQHKGEEQDGDQKGSDQEQAGQPNDSMKKQESGGKANEKESSSQKGASNGGRDDGKQQPDGSEKQPSEGQSSKSDEQQGEKGSSSQTKQTKSKGQGAQKSGEQAAGDQGERGQQGDKKQGGSKDHQSGKDQQGEKGAQPDKKNDQKGGPDMRSGSDDQGQKAAGDKQDGKNGKTPSGGEKGASGEKQGVPNDGGGKSEKDDSGKGKQGEAKEGDEQPKNADGESKPRDGQGGQAKGAGEPDDKMKKHEGESPDQKGGDPDSKDKGEGGAGNNEGANKHGSPTTHGGGQHREKKQISPDSKKGTSDDEPESSGESKRQSDSQGGQQGEQEGGGKAGGGQKANNEGTGAAGQSSEADQGGSEGKTKGKGPTGKKGGDQQKADKPTGGKASGEKGPGTNKGKGESGENGPKGDSPEAADPRGHNNESRQSGEKHPPDGKRQPKQPNNDKSSSKGKPQADASNQSPQGEDTPSDRSGNDLRGGEQRSNPTTGGQPGADETTPLPPSDEAEPGGDDPNQEYARKATDLALEHLKDQLAKDKPDPELLEKLKWTRDDIERFVQQWERLKKSADESGPKGDAARQDLDDALRSLGLSPRGSSLSGGQKRDDRLRNLREGRRAAPPPEYQEQWIEFSKATSKGLKERSNSAGPRK